MASRLSARGVRVVSNSVISFFAIISLLFFLFSIDRTLTVILISSIMLLVSLYLMWAQEELDSVSLLLFFFGTTSCFYFFSEVVTTSWPRAISIVVFAALSLVLTNYLLNTVEPVHNAAKGLYKIALAMIFTEIFWVLSFVRATPISQGAITAVLFFNLQSVTKSILENKFELKRFAFLAAVSIILLAIIFYRI